MEKHRLLHTPQTAYEVKFRICAAGPHVSARKNKGNVVPPTGEQLWMGLVEPITPQWSGLIDSLPLLAAEQVLNVPMGKVLKHSGLR